MESLQTCLGVTWPNVQNLDIRSAVKHDSTEHIQIFDEVTKAVETGLLTQLSNLCVTSKYIVKHINLTTGNYLSDLMDSALMQTCSQDLVETCSSLLTTSTTPSSQIDSLYLNSILGLRSVSLALGFTKVSEATGNYFVSRILRKMAHSATFLLERPFDLHELRSFLIDSLEIYGIPQSHHSSLKTLIHAACNSAQSFLDGQPLDLQPVYKILHDWLETCDSLPPADCSILKSLVNFGCRNLQFGMNGQPLDLKPICPLLKEWIGSTPSIIDEVRPLLKSLVDAVESVVNGRPSYLQLATVRIHEYISSIPGTPASSIKLYRFAVGIFCTFLSCFFTQPLDLQPVCDLLCEWIGKSTSNYFGLPEYPIDKRTLKYLAEGVCTFLECRINKPVHFTPLCNVVNRWIDTTPNLSKSESSFRKIGAELMCILMTPNPDFSLMSPEIREYFGKVHSAQVMNSFNGNLLRFYKFKLRKRGICVYTQYSVSEK